MSVRHLPARRDRVTEPPARVEFSGDLSPAELSELRVLLSSMPKSFDDDVRVIEAWARATLHRAGKNPQHVERYAVDPDAEPTRAWYAAAVVSGLRTLRAHRELVAKGRLDCLDVVAREALKLGALTEEARMRFRLERDALHLAQAGGRARAKQTRRKTRAARAWLREVESRRGGSKEAVYARIARTRGIKAGSVKKAVLRLAKGKPPKP